MSYREQSTVTPVPNLTGRFAIWLRAFYPAPMAVDATERWRAVLGAALGIFVTAIICRWVTGDLNPWLVAPLGASAVLVFAVPASPLAQPWSVVGGNTVSALVGVTAAVCIRDPAAAGAIAVAAAIGAMFMLRCLHPPGGAMALLAVMTQATNFQFVLFPALTNSVLLVAVGIIYNTATQRRYPHVQVVARVGAVGAASRYSSADLDAVLARYNQVLDVSRDDLESILRLTEGEAVRRRLGEVRCSDIMSHELVVVEYATELQTAWLLMRQHRIKALPVIDRAKRIIGIVTLADFMRHANIEEHAGLGDRLRRLIKQTLATHSDKPEVVGQIMTPSVRVAQVDRHIIDLVPLFTEDGHHHIPIIGESNRLVGIITQSDFVRALYRATQVNA